MVTSYSFAAQEFRILRVCRGSRGWLSGSSANVVSRLQEANLCKRFPDAALALLAVLVGDRTEYPPSTLRACLASIREADPKLVVDPRFEALTSYFQRRGKG